MDLGRHVLGYKIIIVTNRKVSTWVNNKSIRCRQTSAAETKFQVSPGWAEVLKFLKMYCTDKNLRVVVSIRQAKPIYIFMNAETLFIFLYTQSNSTPVLRNA
jgi:hypothetical protein